MRLIFVRHGETDWNASDLVQGHKDIPLNARGLDQARKVGSRLRGENIDVIYSSDLARAKQTAAEIARYHEVPVIYSELIRERSFGSAEGMPRLELRKIRESAGLPRHLFRPPGGENYPDIERRIREFLSTIEEKHRGQNVVIVAHGGIIKTFILALTGRPLSDISEIEQNNTAVSVVEMSEGSQPRIHYLNSTEHL